MRLFIVIVGLLYPPLLYFFTKKDIKKIEIYTKKDKYKNSNLKSVDKSYLLGFIKNLPYDRNIIYSQAQLKFDSGVTSTMRDGASDIIDFLFDTWLQIGDFYDNDLFDNQNPKKYITSYIEGRYTSHWAKYLPNGGNDIGTMYANIVDAEVINDLENEIVSIISAISMVSENIDFKIFINEWNTKS